MGNKRMFDYRVAKESDSAKYFEYCVEGTTTWPAELS